MGCDRVELLYFGWGTKGRRGEDRKGKERVWRRKGQNRKLQRTRGGDGGDLVEKTKEKKS